MFGACQYNPKQHRIIKHRVLTWCKNQTTNEGLKNKLFAYHHVKEGTFVIGLWVEKSRGPFVDLLNLGGSMNNFTQAHAESFKQRLFAPISARDMQKQMKEENSNHLHEINDMSGNQSEKTLRTVSTKVSAFIKRPY